MTQGTTPRRRDATWLVALGAALWGSDALLRIPLVGTYPATTIVFLEHVVIVLVTLPWVLPALRAFHQTGLDQVRQRPLDAAVEPAPAAGDALGELVVGGFEHGPARVAEMPPGANGSVGSRFQNRQHRVLERRDGHVRRSPHGQWRRRSGR